MATDRRKKFQGEKKERRLKQRKIKTDVNRGTLILSDGFMCVRVCAQTHANTHMHARSVKVQPSEMSNVRFSSARNMRFT